MPQTERMDSQKLSTSKATKCFQNQYRVSGHFWVIVWTVYCYLGPDIHLQSTFKALGDFSDVEYTSDYT